MPIAIAAAIEVAEHNGWYAADGALIVFDALRNDPHYGIRMEVGESRDPRRPGYWAMVRDGVGRQTMVAGTASVDRVHVAQAALGNYLDLCNGV